MKKLIYILLLTSCSTTYIIEDSNMIKEPRKIEVKERRAKKIIRKLKAFGTTPKYENGTLELYFEHLDRTIKYRKKEIEQLWQKK